MPECVLSLASDVHVPSGVLNVKWKVEHVHSKLSGFVFCNGMVSAMLILHCSQDDVVPFFKILEKEEQIAAAVFDYSISQTTLEEVFINVRQIELFFLLMIIVSIFFFLSLLLHLLLLFFR